MTVVTIEFAIKIAMASSAKASSTKTRRNIDSRTNNRAAKNKQATPKRDHDTTYRHQPFAFGSGSPTLNLTKRVVSGIFDTC